MAHRGSTRAVIWAAALLGTTAFSIPRAEAGGFFIQEQGTYFQGTSFAGMAAGGPSLSAMFWNPATMTQQGLGLASETDATAIFPRSEIHPAVASSALGTNLLPLGPSGDIGRNAFIPASYYTYGWNDRLTFGLAVNAPFALRTQPSTLWAGMFYSRESEVVSYNANPSIAYKVNDWLSIGAGAQIQYLKAKLYSAFPGSGPALALPESLRIDADSVDYGFTAGVTVTPFAGTTIGVGYRSQIDQHLEGDIFRPSFLTIAPPPLPPVPITVPLSFVNFKATLPLPDVVTAGIRSRISDTFTLLGTVEWTNWSRLGIVPVTNVTAPGAIGIPTAFAFGWRDGWLFSAGGEYQWRPNLALRAGIAFERSPIDDQVRTTRLPDNDRFWLSAGGTYKWDERLSLELGYSHIFVKDAPINLVPGNPTFDAAGGLLGVFIGNAQSNIDIVSVALRYRWLPPAPPPLITKG